MTADCPSSWLATPGAPPRYGPAPHPVPLYHHGDSVPDVRWMTYAEAAAALGVSSESVARQMRRHGWARRKGTDNRPRVAVLVKLLPVPDNAGLVLALAFQAQATTERAEAAHLAVTERAAAAEAALAEVRNALAREIRQAEQAEAVQKVAETQGGAALAARDAMQAELATWTAGGPLARAWRGF